MNLTSSHHHAEEVTWPPDSPGHLVTWPPGPLTHLAAWPPDHLAHHLEEPTWPPGSPSHLTTMYWSSPGHLAHHVEELTWPRMLLPKSSSSACSTARRFVSVSPSCWWRTRSSSAEFQEAEPTLSWNQFCHNVLKKKSKKDVKIC